MAPRIRPLKERLEGFTNLLMDQCEFTNLNDPGNYLSMKGHLQSLEVAVRTLKAWDNLDSASTETAEEYLEKKLKK